MAESTIGEEVRRAPFPQYAKTTHSEVLEAIREAVKSFDSFVSKARDFSIELTGEPGNAMLNGSLLQGAFLRGIASDIDASTLPGRWKKPNGGTLEPYANNPIRDKIAAVTHPKPEIPGRKTGFLSAGSGHSGFGFYMSYGAVFEQDGVVYSGVDMAINDRSLDWGAYGWEEIPASEFYAAVEAENARREAEREAETDG